MVRCCAGPPAVGPIFTDEICGIPGLKIETLRQAQGRLWGTRPPAVGPIFTNEICGFPGLKNETWGTRYMRREKCENAGPSTPAAAAAFAQDDKQKRGAQDDGAWGDGMSAAQGNLGDVLGGVQVAGLEGHRSRSAVYLVHKGLGRRRQVNGRRVRQASIAKKGDAITRGV